MDATVCPSCGSTLTEPARDLYALADELGIGEEDEGVGPVTLPSERGLGAAWAELLGIYDDSGYYD